MSIDEVKKYYQALTKDFNDPDEHAKAIDLNSYNRLSIEEITKIDELRHFFGFDENGPYSEFLNKGMKSLRPGFYKICDTPFYNTSIFPHTFSASVYYFHPDYVDGGLIKYEANVGPMTNIHAGYTSLPGTVGYGSEGIPYIKILNDFGNEKAAIGTAENHYYIPKANFFNTLFKEGKIFYVITSEFDPDCPNEIPRPKKVTWSFIDF